MPCLGLRLILKTIRDDLELAHAKPLPVIVFALVSYCEHRDELITLDFK